MGAAQVPAGFERHYRKSPLTDPWEPLYSRKAERAVLLGLMVGEAHCNSRGLAHGGLISALADNAMGLSCGQAMGGDASFVTVSLAVDFLDSARPGQWLQVEPTVIKTGGTLAFAQCLVTADAQPCARANATFRLVKRSTP